MVVYAEDGAVELGECAGSLSRQGRGYGKLNLIETVNKSVTVHLCVSHRRQRAHTRTHNTSLKAAAYSLLLPVKRLHLQKEANKQQPPQKLSVSKTSLSILFLNCLVTK